MGLSPLGISPGLCHTLIEPLQNERPCLLLVRKPRMSKVEFLLPGTEFKLDPALSASVAQISK